MAQSDYSEYMKELEKKLSGNASHENISEEKHTSAYKPTHKKAHKSPFYRVIKIRPGAIIAVIAVIAIIGVTVSVVTRRTSRIKSAKDTQNSTLSDTAASAVTEEPKEPLITYEFGEGTAEIPTTNDAGAAIIVNLETHKVVAARNANEHFYPASTTKVMTLLVAQENIKSYDDTFTMTTDITDPLFVAEATVAGFQNGEVIKMTDLLYGTILPSGADAAVGLATKISGGEAQFVELMNKKVEELGLKNTHFTNVTGLFDKNHYISAYDMAVILETAIQNPLCRKILSTYQYRSNPTNKHPDGVPMSATLFNYMYGTEPETATIVGGKTGFVNESGFCIASFGKNNTTNNEYIVVTLKNSSRWPAIHGQIDLYKQFVQ